MPTFDCIAVGNAVIDAFLTLSNLDRTVELDKTGKRLSLPYGAKIPVKDCEFLLGGNACNVSVGLRRAGYKTALFAELAKDEFSDKIVNGLKKEGVDISEVIRNDGQTSFSVSLNYKGERTIFSEHQERSHPFFFRQNSTRLMYLTSLGNRWTHVYQRAVQYISTHHDTVLAFNPGSPQFGDGVESFDFVLSQTTILFLNKEEAERIAKYTGECQDLLVRLQKKGPRIIVITDGPRGSYCVDERGSIYHKGALRVPNVERTGAGDAFATGFIAGYLQDKTIEQCLSWGTHNSASVIGSIGAQTGLLTDEELKNRR